MICEDARRLIGRVDIFGLVQLFVSVSVVSKRSEKLNYSFFEFIESIVSVVSDLIVAILKYFECFIFWSWHLKSMENPRI